MVNLVLIPKSGNKTESTAFRSICLLNMAAKAMESLIVARLTKETKEKGALSEAQYGFRKQRSTLAAVDRVLKTARAEMKGTLKTRNFVLPILPDVRNVFDNMNWRTLMVVLEEKVISTYLCRVLSSYLKNGRLEADGTKYRVTAGVPQGAVFGPTLWNLAYDGVLQISDLLRGAETTAHADDLALIIKARAKGDLENKVNGSLELVNRWMEEHYLRLAAEKTKPAFNWQKEDQKGQSLFGRYSNQFQKKARYPGVMLDIAMSAKAHIKYVAAKAGKTALNMFRILPRVGGASEGHRRFLTSVKEARALSAALMWADTTATHC